MPFLSARFLLPVHIVQILLVITIVILAVVRLLIKGGPMGRTDTMALGMGFKSLIIIAYQLLSEHNKRFKKWASWKANTILNCLEVVFWAAVAYMAIQSNMQSCIGITCILNWIVIVLAIINSMVASYAAAVSYVEFRAFKLRREANSSTENLYTYEQGQKSMESV